MQEGWVNQATTFDRHLESIELGRGEQFSLL